MAMPRASLTCSRCLARSLVNQAQIACLLFAKCSCHPSVLTELAEASGFATSSTCLRSFAPALCSKAHAFSCNCGHRATPLRIASQIPEPSFAGLRTDLGMLAKCHRERRNSAGKPPELRDHKPASQRPGLATRPCAGVFTSKVWDHLPCPSSHALGHCLPSWPSRAALGSPQDGEANSWGQSQAVPGTRSLVSI